MRRYGRVGPSHPLPGRAAEKATRWAAERLFARRGLVTADSEAAAAVGAELRRRIANGERTFLIGIGPSGHNAGAALIEVRADGSLSVVCNEEEERYRGIKHYNRYPYQSVAAVRERLRALSATPADVVAAFATWDYVQFAATIARVAAEELPATLITDPGPFLHPKLIAGAAFTARRLGRQLGHREDLQVIAMRHHDAHAAAFALSPFAQSAEPVMVSVIDGFGDDASISLYLWEEGSLRLWWKNDSPFDSLGGMYAMVSSTQGGWPPLSSEGRYMGAAAWGDGNRLTNPFYPQLRELLHFGPGGEVRLNRALANWPRRATRRPYTAALEELLGPPVAPEDMWNPDAVLSVDDIEHADPTRERVDKAAALQLVFEDGLFHVLGNFIRTTGSDKLVLTGGTALNCTANMKLLDHFDERFYGLHVGDPRRRLHLWVPPTPGDAGLPFGSPVAFALRHGARPGPPMHHAFLCGRAPAVADVRRALTARNEIDHVELGNTESGAVDVVSGLVAWLIADGGVVGIFHGAGETGPRALGHRSILANPCRADALQQINATVKYRERIRPLAPMVTLGEAHRLFELSGGASDDDYNAYNYMVITAVARPEAVGKVPAVVHEDGTSRLQIVRESDPLTYACLIALGQTIGVEAAVNTSLNVGAPIAHSPRQALDTLSRAKGMDGLVMIADDGEAFFAWHRDRPLTAEMRFARWHRETGGQAAAI